jgi:hypothetical protein
MKRKKAKPEIVWMPWHPEPGFAPEHWEYSKSNVMYSMACEWSTDWPQLRKEGWRIKRVKITEV